MSPIFRPMGLVVFGDRNGFIFSIVGCVMDKTMTKELVISAWKMAYKHQKPGNGVIHHSDRGVQYTSSEYQKPLRWHFWGYRGFCNAYC